MSDGPWLTPDQLRVCRNSACLHRIEWGPTCRACHTKTEPLTANLNYSPAIVKHPTEEEPCERDERKRQR